MQLTPSAGTYQVGLNMVDADLICADVGESDAITLVANVEEPHAPPVITGVNAFQVLAETQTSCASSDEIHQPI